jgi:hypothetical protein
MVLQIHRYWYWVFISTYFFSNTIANIFLTMPVPSGNEKELRNIFSYMYLFFVTIKKYVVFNRGASHHSVF